jgi:hypothetical protein
MPAIQIIQRRLRQAWSGVKFDYLLRAKLGMGLVVVFLFISGWEQFTKDWRSFDQTQIGNDGISVYEKRFDGLRTVLPPHATIGYVSDAEPYDIEYYLTQYTLAPLTVDPKQSHDLVIGNFVNKASNPTTWNGANLDPLLDLGNGVKLFNSK